MTNVAVERPPASDHQPSVRLSVSLPLRALGHWMANYRRTWKGTIFSGVLEPVFFLAAMGIGLGTIVNANTGGQGLDGFTYLEFLAPGLLAANALQTAMFESTYPVMGGTRWDKKYFAQIATPLRPRDVFRGHLIFIAFRVVSMAAIFLAVMTIFGVTRSPLSVFALLVALLLGLAVATPVCAFAVSQEDESGFAMLFRFGLVPMFLFSGTFFPVSQLPDAIEWLAWLSPLWHGVDLMRALVLGGEASIGLGLALAHVGYLALWLVVGYVLGARAYHRKLVS
jgi:lipooligosaccharide transport system permease protein